MCVCECVCVYVFVCVGACVGAGGRVGVRVCECAGVRACGRAAVRGCGRVCYCDSLEMSEDIRSTRSVLRACIFYKSSLAHSSSRVANPPACLPDCTTHLEERCHDRPSTRPCAHTRLSTHHPPTAHSLSQWWAGQPGPTRKFPGGPRNGTRLRSSPPPTR